MRVCYFDQYDMNENNVSFEFNYQVINLFTQSNKGMVRMIFLPVLLFEFLRFATLAGSVILSSF